MAQLNIFINYKGQALRVNFDVEKQWIEFYEVQELDPEEQPAIWVTDEDGEELVWTNIIKPF